jgi:hypothetical protein
MLPRHRRRGSCGCRGLSFCCLTPSHPQRSHSLRPPVVVFGRLLGIRHDRGRVAVDQDHAVALFAEGAYSAAWPMTMGPEPG